jgi:putative intracellular protease/amidase
MNIVFVLFDGLTALDAVGPYEVLARIPGAEVTFAGLSPGPVRTGDRALGLVVDQPLERISSCDLLVMPGGIATRALEHDERLLAWLRAVDATTQITASVCTGALVLAAAGLLVGRRASTHWAARERLAALGAVPVAERVVRDGKYATAAGVSAGIDLALWITSELVGPEVAQAIQLGIEYDPAPPFDAGDAAKAPPLLKELVLERLRSLETGSTER